MDFNVDTAEENVMILIAIAIKNKRFILIGINKREKI